MGEAITTMLMATILTLFVIMPVAIAMRTAMVMMQTMAMAMGKTAAAKSTITFPTSTRNMASMVAMIQIACGSHTVEHNTYGISDGDDVVSGRVRDGDKIDK